jgi:flavin-dependent dehydrogenase
MTSAPPCAQAGFSMNNPSSLAAQATVIGGSVAGLVAARVLADHFDEVTILERDQLPDEPRHRPGVPQSHHLHVLIGGGQSALERLFPGLEADLLAAGAVEVHWPADILWLTAADWCQRFAGRHKLVACSRELLEWTVRYRLLALARVRVLDGQDVVGLRSTSDSRTVTGVQVRSRGPADDSVHELSSSFVVDASGRGSRAPRWLTALGYPATPETNINAFLGYASAVYERPAGVAPDWRAVYLQARPPLDTRLGGLFSIEGGRWIVSLSGAGGDFPPTDDDGFTAFARSLRSPLLADAIAGAERVSPIRGYQRTHNQRRHFERLPRWPEQFVVVGDAACAFNPIYGHGMTVAAQTALLLDRLLREHRRTRVGLSRRVQQGVAHCNSAAWLIATGEDLRYPTTEGARPDLTTRLLRRYLDRVTASAMTHAGVNHAFLDVLNLLEPPTRLFRPDVLWPALTGSRCAPGPRTTSLAYAPRSVDAGEARALTA